jgi:hypothetical protein
VGRIGTPLVGGAAAFIVGITGLLGLNGSRASPLIVIVAGSIAMIMGSRWMLKRGVLSAPLMRQRGTNLVATKIADPEVWLCAHLDTKSQLIPTFLRTAAIITQGIGFAMTFVLATALAFGAQFAAVLWAVAALVTLTGAAFVVSCVVGSRSPGALDNASGVVTVIEAARHLRDDAKVGVLITDAEELGLAGARAWSHAVRATHVLNCDGVDDGGMIHVMHTSARPDRLLRAAVHASQTTGIPVQTGRLAFGILTDSVAFADAGVSTVTFSRGTVRSLFRVHSKRDDLGHLRGTGIPDTATIMATTARELLRSET